VYKCILSCVCVCVCVCACVRVCEWMNLHAFHKLELHGGVVTEWTGVDMSTSLLPDIVPEIDVNPVSFFQVCP